MSYSRFLAPLVACALGAPALLPANTLVLQQGAEIRYNGFGIGLTYTELRQALLDEAAPDTNAGGASAPDLMPLVPPGGGTATQVLFAFDGFVGPEPWQIQPGSTITSAYLVLPFTTPGDDLRFGELLAPWDEAAVTWNNFGPQPSNGVAFPAEAFPAFTLPLPVPEQVVDVTPLVQIWVDDPAMNRGLSIDALGPVGTTLQGPNFFDPSQLDGGLPFYIPSGQTGVQDSPDRNFAMTDPMLLNEGALAQVALLIDFNPPPPPLLNPLGNVLLSPPQMILPPDPLLPPMMVWDGVPGMVFKPQFNPGLDPGGWICPPDLPAQELAPGQYMALFPPLPGGGFPPVQFGRIQGVDDDGDGFFDNRQGASEAAADKEDCPENGLAPLFRHVERSGRLLLAATNEQERNSLVQEIRTVQLIYEFAKRYHNGVYGVPFQKTIEAILKGQKPQLPNESPENRMRLIKDAFSYLRFMLWWEMTYNEKLTQEERDSVRQLHDEMVDAVENLCALEPFTPGDQAAFDTICNNALQKINDARDGQTVSGTSTPSGVLLKKLLVKLVSEGAKGLWERLLTNIIGKGFVEGTFAKVNAALDAIMSIVNGVAFFLQEGNIEQARREFNKALCELHDKAAELPKFNLVDDGVDLFEVTHSGKIHPQMKSTTVKPFAYKWVPSTEPGAQPGDGEWVEEELTMEPKTPHTGDDPPPPPPKELTFLPGEAETQPGSSTRAHSFIVNMPDTEPGEKAYVVYKVTRRWCTPDGATVVQTDFYFRGVVKQSGDL